MSSTSQHHPGSPLMSQAHLCAFAAYAMWGVFPLFWHLFGELPAWQILAYRIISSQVFLTAYLLQRKELTRALAHFRDVRRLGMLFLSSLCITGNWLLYIWAVNSGHVIESSMGYFITPLVNVLLGVVCFRERPRPLQWLAISIATAAVMVLAIAYGQVPWVALSLALTFGMYGALKKISPVSSTSGLWTETSLVLIPALLMVAYDRESSFATLAAMPTLIQGALLVSGLVTALPLVLFAIAARGMPLATMGFFQYMAPILQFICALAFFQEPMDSWQWGVFALIWLALGIFSLDAVRKLRANRRAVAAVTA